MPDNDRNVAVDDLLKAISKLEANANGKRSWLSRHQSITIAIVGGIVGVISWGINSWSATRVLEVQAPIDSKQDTRASTLEQKLSVETEERKRAAARLRQNDVDLVDFLLESERWNSAMLDGIAARLKVPKPDRAALDRATESALEIKVRGREPQ